MFSPPPRPFAGRRAPPCIPLVCCLLLVLVGCERMAASSDEPVVFGMAAPLNESYGQSALLGAELARKQVNARGGIDGRRLELRVVSDSADPARAIAVAAAFARDPAVVAVAGHVNSGTTRAAAQVYNRYGLPAVATSATSSILPQLGPWIFRVASSDSANAVALAHHARGIGRHPAILYANDDYGRGLAKNFAAAAATEGNRTLESDPYLPDTEDFTPYLRRMKTRGVDLIFIAGLETEAARAIRQARGLGLETRVLGGDGLEGLVGMGPDFDGVRVGLLFHPNSSPAAREFVTAYRAAYGRDPDSFAATAYDAVGLLARAAENARAKRNRIRAYLEGVGHGGAPAYEGAAGTIRFDANGDPVGKAFPVGVIRGGSFEQPGREQ